MSAEKAVLVPTTRRRLEGRPLGLAALGVVILLFSLGSTLVKLAHTPSVAIAFWRMLLCSVIWIAILRVSERRWLTWADIRAALLPGLAFGLNIVLFFTGVTKTTIASAEFTGALTPLFVVPLAAVLFHEKVRLASFSFGLVSLAGLAVVLFNAPSNGEFSWRGVAWIACALVMWTTYLLTSRTLRQGRSVATVMASITPVATLVTLVVGLVFVREDLFEITWRSVVFITLLAVLTGTIAHGLMVFAQRLVPIGVISMLQVSQPGLSVLWSVWFLSSSVRPIQLVGMAMVVLGLVLVTIQTQRDRD